MADASVTEDCRKYGVIYYNLITNVGGKICRSVLCKEVGKTEEGTLSNYLSKIKRRNVEYRSDHKLHDQQFDTLYPGGTAASDAEKFDITLLMFIFINFIFQNPEKSKLTRSLENIPDADQTVAADLSRIRCYRNKLHEIADTKLSMGKQKFDEYVKDLRNVFTRLAKTYNLSNIEKSVEEELGAEFVSLETQIKKILEEIKQDKIWAYTIMKAIQNKQNPYKDVKDVLPDAVFVETEQYKETKKYLLDEHIIFLDGSPGEGKTTIAKKLLTEIHTTFDIMSETADNNFKHKLRYLIKECGQRTFHLLIEQSLENEGTDFSSFLHDNEETVRNLRAEHVITDEEVQLLYPHHGTPSLEDAGFTLLNTLVRAFFCNLPNDDQLWYKGSKPEPNDLTTAADVVRLRNHILELDEMALTEDIFADKCNDLNQIFTRLGTADACSETLKIVESLICDDEMINTLLEEFNKWNETHQNFETGFNLDINWSKCRRFRLYTLLVDGGTRVFKHIFDDKIPPADLQTVLSKATTKATLTNLKAKKIMTVSQEQLLNPSHGCPKSANFDITLLAMLLRNICGFNQNDKRWDDKNPVAADTSIIADIVRIREARNEVISHLSQTGKLSKEEFARHWDRISKVLLRLDGNCKVPFGNLKSEIDDLKSKNIDPEQDKEYQRIIENWKQTDERFESKVMQYLKESTLESSFELSKETVKDVLADKYFVETEQFHAAEEKLLQNKIIVLNGAPGEGKTTVAKKLLLKVSNNQRYIQLHSYAEWETVNIEGADAILIDDMFGTGSFDKEECRKWQKHIPSIAAAVDKKRLFVIITSRKYILLEAIGKMYFRGFFTEENIVTLSSKDLEKCEKKSILENHFSKASDENISFRDVTSSQEHSDIVKEIVELRLSGSELGGLTIGFPECTRLFSSNLSLYKRRVDFFKHPMACVKSYISELLADDDDTLIAFFVLWSQKSKFLTSLELERPIDEIAKTIIEPIRKLQFQPEKHIRKIRHVLRQHCGGFISFENMSETFTFSHRVVQDAVGLVSYEINPTAVIAHSDSSFIDNYIHVNTYCQSDMSLREKDAESIGSVTPGNVHRCMQQLKIHISPARYLQICCRLRSILIKQSSEASVQLVDLSIFRLSLFDDKIICSTFLDALYMEGCLNTFLLAKTRSLISEFVGFRFLKNVSTEMGVLSYFVWMKEDVCPLIEICLDKMVCLGLTGQKKQELDISLLVSVKLGKRQMVNFLLEKGAKVDINHISVAIVTGREDILELLKNEEFISKNVIMQKACKAGYSEVVAKLLNDGEIDLKQPGVSKQLIQNAIVGGHPATFKLILQNQTSFANMVFDLWGNELPLYHFVVSKQNAGLIDALTENGFRPTKVDGKGRTPLLYAIHSGKISVIDKLLQLSIEDNVHCLPDNDQITPLNEAITKITTSSRKDQNYFYGLALRLCKFKDNISLKNKYKESALNIACKHQLIQIVNEVLKVEDPFVKEGSTLFHSFVATDNIGGISTLLKCNIDPNVHDRYHRTPFMLANAMQKTTIVRLLNKDERIQLYNKRIGIVSQDETKNPSIRSGRYHEHEPLPFFVGLRRRPSLDLPVNDSSGDESYHGNY